MPPTPSAMSSPRLPVDTVETSRMSASAPSFMIEPLPKDFSIWLTAKSNARSRFESMVMFRSIRPCSTSGTNYRENGSPPKVRRGRRQGKKRTVSSAAERDGEERRVHRAVGAQLTAIEDHLFDAAAAEDPVAVHLE